MNRSQQESTHSSASMSRFNGRVMAFIKAMASSPIGSPEGLSYDLAELYEEGRQDGMTELAQSILAMMQEQAA